MEIDCFTTIFLHERKWKRETGDRHKVSPFLILFRSTLMDITIVIIVKWKWNTSRSKKSCVYSGDRLSLAIMYSKGVSIRWVMRVFLFLRPPFIHSLCPVLWWHRHANSCVKHLHNCVSFVGLLSGDTDSDRWMEGSLPVFLFSSKRKERGKAEAVVCVYDHLVKPCPAYSPAPSFSVVLLPLRVLLWVCQLVCSQLNCFWIFISERWKGK